MEDDATQPVLNDVDMNGVGTPRAPSTKFTGATPVPVAPPNLTSTGLAADEGKGRNADDNASEHVPPRP
eukprot:8905527-Alexandrium_andersonii.AAC.1